MQTIVYHSKARKTMCGMGTFCLIGMISFQLTMQNGDIITGVDRFPPANTGAQEITVNFPEPMRGAPKVFAMWEDTTITLTYVDGLVITGATSSGFKIATNRLKPSENWWFCYIAIYNR